MAKPLSKVDLKDKLREYGQKLGGSKSELERRLKDYQSQHLRKSSTSAPDAEDAAEDSLQPSHPLTGKALNHLMPDGDYSTATYRCLELMGIWEASEDEGHVDENIESKLQPLVLLVSALVKSAGSTDLQSSHGTNFRDLQRDVRTTISEDLTTSESAVLTVIRIFIPDLEATTEAHTELDHAGSDTLAREAARIKQGIEAYLRRWTQSFPSPSKGIWPDDFKPLEKSKIRQFIATYVTDASRNLLIESVAEDAITATVNEILADSKFPVAKGHNDGAVKQVVKLIRREELNKAAKKKKAEEVVDAGGEAQEGQQGSGKKPRN